MIDIVDRETRSKMMARIRSKNTKPELRIRKGLHRRGFRFRLHPKYIVGRPDLFLRRYNAAIFVNGCFWHGHDCSLFRMPTTRREFWENKISRNRQRDSEVSQVLNDMGIRQLSIWECALRGPTRLGEEATLQKAVHWLLGAEMIGSIHG